MTVSYGADGRGTGGRFAPGNRHGRGNPHLSRLADAQAAVRDAIAPDELRQVLRKLLAMALGGDVQAARVLLDRVCGRPDNPPQEQLHHVVDSELAGPPMPSTPDLLASIETLRELAQGLRLADDQSQP